jgi:osmotically-inducible protein OsmY
MTRLLVLMAVAAVSAGCSANTATQERQDTQARQANPPMQAEAVAPAPATVAVPDNPADRGIRRDLALAIARDAHLHNREISYIVVNGDVSVTGIVQTEQERRKINDLAMGIDGVKSVANALRVAE